MFRSGRSAVGADDVSQPMFGTSCTLIDSQIKKKSPEKMVLATATTGTSGQDPVLPLEVHILRRNNK
jgi:hypothetical protein